MAEAHVHHRSTAKETLTSITIAFILAFVFRAFVIEAFVIPTGSMAPTLMGAHVQIRSERTAFAFPAGPAEYTDRTGQTPSPLQRGSVRDPMLGPAREAEIDFTDKPIRAGDRILVLKYLRGVFEPSRFDVVVFKSPVDPQTNFIKRLVGLPGEQIALVDGDVFVRDASLALDPSAPTLWNQDGWHIARKPERVQRAVWQQVFDSAYTPLNPLRDGRRYFHSPWVGQAGWQIEDSPSYRYEGSGPTTLDWSDDWPIRDRYAYDETLSSLGRRDDKFPVSDLRLRAGIKPDGPLSRVAAVITARGHEFKAEVDADGSATLAMRPIGEGDWTEMATEKIQPLPAGRVTDVEFWHVDQSLQLWVNNHIVAYAEYDWTPEQRIFNATGESIVDLANERGANAFADESNYRKPKLRWEFDGSPLTLYRVGLERDLHYQAWTYGNNPDTTISSRAGQPAAATHPNQPMELSDREYFCCGDNSPASSDGRLWDRPDPWVAQLDEEYGVVPEELMIGRAFFVYFPSPIRRFQGYRLWIPDAGRLRLIW
jgi:signal peptidase I